MSYMNDGCDPFGIPYLEISCEKEVKKVNESNKQSNKPKLINRKYNAMEMEIKNSLYSFGVTNCTVKYEKTRFKEDLSIITYSLSDKCLELLREKYNFYINFKGRVDYYNGVTKKNSHHKPVYCLKKKKKKI